MKKLESGMLDSQSGCRRCPLERVSRDPRGAGKGRSGGFGHVDGDLELAGDLGETVADVGVPSRNVAPTDK